MQLDCIVLAGGLGTRLQSVVSEKPKCLADINGKPFLFYLAKQLQKYTIRKLIFSVGYKKEMIIEYVEKHADEFPFEILFAEEEEPLGTGGAVLNALRYSDTEDFLVMNGDTFFNVDIHALYAFQKSKMADCTLALKPLQNTDRYGLVTLNDSDEIESFEEKKENTSGLINGGVYCVYRKAFENIPFTKKFSFEKDFLEKYISERNMVGFVQNAYFIDIGIPDDYTKAQHDFLNYTSL
jgi:D-glycero-alpha-D-manno-heptose 1-phosphate guanylyltransferase